MKKISFRLVISTITLGMMGCLKDKQFDSNVYGLSRPDNSPIGVGFPEAEKKINVIQLKASADPKDVVIGAVNLLSDEAAQQDYHITLVVDTMIVHDYNADSNNLSKLTILPDSLISTVLKVTIPKGSHYAFPGIKIPNPSNLDATKVYGFGLKIASVQEAGVTIATNASKLLLSFVVVNPLAGNYQVDGYFFHPASPRMISRAKALSTQSATRVIGNLGDLGANGYQFSFAVDASKNLVNWMSEGSTPTNPSSGFFTADNPGGLTYPSLQPGAAPYLQSTYNNTYDDANGIFWMHYGYGVGSTDQTGWSRNVYEKWVKQ